jgi:four helix bundle protein
LYGQPAPQELTTGLREERNQNPIFIHKLKIVEEELDESLFFLELLAEFNGSFETEINELYKEGEILLKIIVASIVSSR